MADTVEERALRLLELVANEGGREEVVVQRIARADVYARLAVAKAINQLSTEVGSGLTHMVNEMWKR